MHKISYLTNEKVIIIVSFKLQKKKKVKTEQCLIS